MIAETANRVRRAAGQVRLAAWRTAGSFRGADPRTVPWNPRRSSLRPGGRKVQCNLCGWQGPDFVGGRHSEAATCFACGSIARDRFLWWCFQRRTPYRPGLRLLETSPRLGAEYQRFMAGWCDYVTSDYMRSMHSGTVALDLQRLGLRDGCLDVVLTAHVLEHVADTDAALSELRRVLRPGGRLYLQVPVQQGLTSPPPRPEYHGDNTLVHWRFGFDLTERLRKHGFESRLLCTEDFTRRTLLGRFDWPDWPFECPLDELLAGVRPADLTTVASDAQARRHGFEPSFWFLTWEAIRSA